MTKKSEVKFPKGRIKISDNAYIQYNSSYENKFNNDLNKAQVFIDNKVIMNLQEYVSLKTKTQEKSIRIASDVGSGIVTIGVPYAEYQAYSSKIKKRVGKRGTRPFERMKADKKETILRQVAEYSKRLNNG